MMDFLVNRIHINALQKFSRGLSARACSPGASVACACSLLLGLCFNAGRATENSSERVLIVLALSCYRSESRATAVEDRRPKFKSGYTLVWFDPPTPAVGHRLVHVNGQICFGSATPTCMGDHESLEARGVLVEEESKWKWLR